MFVFFIIVLIYDFVLLIEISNIMFWNLIIVSIMFINRRTPSYVGGLRRRGWLLLRLRGPPGPLGVVLTSPPAVLGGPTTGTTSERTPTTRPAAATTPGLDSTMWTDKRTSITTRCLHTDSRSQPELTSHSRSWDKTTPPPRGSGGSHLSMATRPYSARPPSLRAEVSLTSFTLSPRP
jgi:hypothetical protein